MRSLGAAVRQCLAVLLCGATIAPVAAHAGEVIIVKPFGAVSIHSPMRPVPPGGPAPYTASGPAAGWGVVAWDIPGGDLSPFTTIKGDYGTVSISRAAAATVTVTRAPTGETVIGLSQDGAVLPCLSPGGGPRESDLFLSPNESVNAFDVSGYAATSHAYPLTALRHLTAIATVSYRAGRAAKKETCGVAQGSVMIAVIFDNRIRHQTLFYQLALTLICGPQPAPRQAFCRAMQSIPRSNFFSTRNPFGIDDRLPLLGQPFLMPEETTTVHVDLLPRVLGFLRTAPWSMDPDPSHWSLGSIYAGQNIWGGVSLSTQWSALQLVADTAP